MKTRYCTLCDRAVPKHKDFNWLLFIVLCFTMVGWAFYLIYYFMKPDVCPICGNKTITMKKAKKIEGSK